MVDEETEVEVVMLEIWMEVVKLTVVEEEEEEVVLAVQMEVDVVQEVLEEVMKLLEPFHQQHKTARFMAALARVVAAAAAGGSSATFDCS